MTDQTVAPFVHQTQVASHLGGRDESSDSILFRRCPASGLPVFEKTEWRDVELGPEARATFRIIGQNILLVTFSGLPEGEAANRFFAERRALLESTLEDGAPFFELHDYQHAQERPSRTHRELLVRNLSRDRGRLQGLWAFNATLPVKLSLTLARSLSWSDLPVYVAPDYATAVNRAVEAMQRRGVVQPSPRYHVFRRESWAIEDPHFQSQFEIINGDILHSESSGRMRPEHIPMIEAMRERLGRKMALGDTTPHYFAAGVGGLRGVTNQARHDYLASIRHWYERRRFGLFVVYGASPALRALVSLARVVVPFKVAVARDLDHALRIIRDHKARQVRRSRVRRPSDDAAVDRNRPEEASRVVDELLQFIGDINWERPGTPLPEAVTADHPFQPVFDAIGLIKEELDEAHEEQRAAAEDRERLQELLLRSQKLEAVGTLAGGIAHDFNNILSAIVGYVELAQMETPADSRVGRHLGHVARAADRARDLIAQILSFSRQDPGPRKPLDPRPVVKEALKLMRASIPSNVTLELDVTDQPITVAADPTQLHRMVVNLCTNAAHAMEPDGGTLGVTLRSTSLTAKDEAVLTGRTSEGGWMELLISDTGCGIDPATRAKIFDPYFTTKEAGKGTGMGLSVVHGIVESHQGLIGVTSEPGRGATFRVVLPTLAEAVSHDESGDLEVPRGTERVLVVDDEWPLVQAAQEILSGLGYEVTGRTSSVEALEAFRAAPDRFDLVVTDLTMPNLAGDRLIEAIHRLRPDVPFILCSGFSANLTAERARALGIRFFLPKPIGISDLATAVRDALDGRSEFEP